MSKLSVGIAKHAYAYIQWMTCCLSEITRKNQQVSSGQTGDETLSLVV